jgi:aminomethyltransferase
MVPFAGYDMPLQYQTGVLAEHRLTRESAGLFDVSHMGQITLQPAPGRSLAMVAAALEALVPGDIVSLKPGRQRYTQLTADYGGILDDLMVGNLGDRLLLIVNATTKATDLAHLRAHLPAEISIEMPEDRVLLALQGPEAPSVLADLADGIGQMRFMDIAERQIAGVPAIVSRSGYTGEDGFEISLPASQAEAVMRRLLADSRVGPVGLAARDSLRLEAGLCLYGADIGLETTPVEAALSWSIPPVRRIGGAREGGFPGAAAILTQLAEGAGRTRVGLQASGRVPVRAGAIMRNEAGEAVGTVTSGGFGPTVDAPIAMGLVASSWQAPGTILTAAVRGIDIPLTIVPLPFVPQRYHRG